MKKIVTLLALSLLSVPLFSQPWMPANSQKPLRFFDICKEYESHPFPVSAAAEQAGVGRGGESGDFQFERWAWYWRQHLDENGYMVTSAKNYQEWQLQQKTQVSNGAQSRSTAGRNAQWVFQGPDSTQGGYWGIGRINTVAFHPTDPKIIYAGAAGGGLWKSVDSGQSWKSLFANFPTEGVSDIVVNPLNPNTIYVATGDADGYSNFSMGVIKSIDGGATWSTTALNWTPMTYNWIRSMVMNPRDTNKLFIATRGGIYGSTDGLRTIFYDTSGDFTQLLYHPTDTNIIYATRYALWPDSSSQILRSVDGGATWQQITHFTRAQRVNLAVCPAGPNIVKAIASQPSSGLDGIYGSSDTGASFSLLYYNDTSCTQNLLGWDNGLPSSGCGGQGWYDLAIAMHPNDPNKVIIGGVNNYFSNDGGSTWQLATNWYGISSTTGTVHADKHCLKYNRVDLTLYEGCDGGIYRTGNPASADWQSITDGMGITQFYRNAVANGAPFCIGGAQDNGTKMVNGLYADLTGGDGMQCRIDYNDPLNTWYTSSQNGYIDQTNDGGISYHGISTTIPDTLSGIWLTPYMLHPRVSSTILVGIDILFASFDMGATWNQISPQFTPLSKINFITMSPANDSIIYLVVQGAYNYNNSLKYTTNFGATWDSIAVAGFTASISQITADPKNANIVWVTFSGYGTDKVASYNLTTHSWTVRNAGLPNVPVNCIVIDSFSHTKYVGTDIGVYYMDSTMTSWAVFSSGMPVVQVEDLNINYTTNEMWAATYGRGMWKTVKREYPTGVSIVPYNSGIITVSPNPNHGEFTVATDYQALKGTSVSVRLIAMNGITAWGQHVEFDASGNLTVNAKGLKPGVYVCETTNGNATARSRVVIY